jgi:hypothetical protein
LVFLSLSICSFSVDSRTDARERHRGSGVFFESEDNEDTDDGEEDFEEDGGDGSNSGDAEDSSDHDESSPKVDITN